MAANARQTAAMVASSPSMRPSPPTSTQNDEQLVNNNLVCIPKLLAYLYSPHGYTSASKETIDLLAKIIPAGAGLDDSYLRGIEDLLLAEQISRSINYSRCLNLLAMVKHAIDQQETLADVLSTLEMSKPAAVIEKREGKKQAQHVNELFQGRQFKYQLIEPTDMHHLAFADPVSGGIRVLEGLMPFTVMPETSVVMLKQYLLALIKQFWREDFDQISSDRITKLYPPLDDMAMLVFAQGFLLGFEYPADHSSLSDVVTLVKSCFVKIRQDRTKVEERYENRRNLESGAPPRKRRAYNRRSSTKTGIEQPDQE